MNFSKVSFLSILVFSQCVTSLAVAEAPTKAAGTSSSPKAATPAPAAPAKKATSPAAKTKKTDANVKPAISADEEEAPEPLPTWTEQKVKLKNLENRFRDKSLSKDAKVKLLPEANALLSEMQEIKMSAQEKSDQISTVVTFLSVTLDADFANSNTSTVYFDYKANQKTYDKEIAKLGSKDVKKKLTQAFKDWAEFEKESEKTEGASESDTEE